MTTALSIVANVVLATTVPAPISSKSLECIALERGNGGSPVIKARVNNVGPFAFVLDTGASGTTLDDARIKQLGLVPDGSAEQAQGMGGTTDVRLFRLGQFQTGPLAVRDMVVPGIPAPSFTSHDIVGLAGVDIFGRHLITWRWDQSCVNVGISGSKPLGSGWKPIRSRWLKPWKVLIPMKVGTIDGWGLLDTGAQKSVLSPGFARAVKLGKSDTPEHGAITGIDGKETALAAYRVSGTIGSWSYRNVRVSVAALPLFDRLGGMNEAVAVIGMDWIESNQFAVDYGSKKVWQRGSQSKRLGDRR